MGILSNEQCFKSSRHFRLACAMFFPILVFDMFVFFTLSVSKYCHLFQKCVAIYRHGPWVFRRAWWNKPGKHWRSTASTSSIQQLEKRNWRKVYQHTGCCCKFMIVTVWYLAHRASFYHYSTIRQKNLRSIDNTLCPTGCTVATYVFQ